MRKKKSESQETPAVGGGRITPIDVQQVEFRLAFRGYNERDVDAFLDRVTEDLSSYLEENQRLRTGSVSVAPAATPEGVEAARREAEEILTRAREEAAEIVRRAEREAAAVRAAAGAGGGDARTAVAPFLNREREFLQSLGSIVQSHAEEIKTMVMTLRARAESPGAAAVVGSTASARAPEPAETLEPESAPQSAPEPADLGAASVAEIRERLGEGEGEGEGEGDDTSVPAGDVVVDATEPVYSPKGAQAGEGRERSLRELFWGDE